MPKKAAKKRVKKTKKPAIAKKKKPAAKKETPKTERYFAAVGRRKTASARVRLYQKKGKISVNNKELEQYFAMPELGQIVRAPLTLLDCLDQFSVSSLVKGGGLRAQAEAVRHGITRALVKFNPDFRKQLKSAGFLTRDPRMRERKKFGLKRARRAPQWQKR